MKRHHEGWVWFCSTQVWPGLGIRVALLALVMLVPDLAQAETVVARRRVGNNAEAMTYDPANDRAVVMDGNDVIGVALTPLDAVVLATMRNDTGGISGIGFRKLFDVLALPLEAREPKGVVYVPGLHRYYFTTDNPGGTGLLFSTDDEGHPRPPLVITGLSVPVDFWEGLAWIPPGAPAHGGTIAALGGRNTDFLTHVFFIRLDGSVEQELIPAPGTPVETYFCGIAYQPTRSSTLLLSDCFSAIFSMNVITGAPVGDQPLFPIPATSDVEGIVVRNNGAVVLSGYEGRLFAYDRSLRRTPGDDRLFTVGIGQGTQWLTWNFDSHEFIGTSPVGGHVFALSADLSQVRQLFDLDVSNELQSPWLPTYLGNNQLGISNAAPSGIGILQMVSDDIGVRPNGTIVSRMDWYLTPPFLPARTFGPRGFSVLDPADPTTFVFRGNADPSALKVITTRGGTPKTDFYPDGITPVLLSEIRLSSPTAGLSAQVFDNGSGRRIFTGAEIYGIDGTLQHRIDWQQLGLSKPPTNGVWIGGNTFAAVDGLTSTVVIYSVP
jgi:hypothetical protein